MEEIEERLNKISLGQFYTTNYQYLLKDIDVPEKTKYRQIIEPFAGNADLLEFLGENRDVDYQIECYDIAPKKSYIVKRDTLKDPPEYKDKYVITNPPYLARNKNKDKILYDMYKTNDLYKCFMEQIITDNPLGGILIIPTNFWCSIRLADINLRKRFLHIFQIVKLKIFEESVFDDTNYAVCTFQFILKENPESINKIPVSIHFDKKEISTFETVLDDTNIYTFGGEIYTLIMNNKIKIDRLTKNNLDDKEFITNINVKCIDDNIDTHLGLIYIDKMSDRYVDTTPNLSARSYATLVIKPKLSKKSQKELVKHFNKYIEEQRSKYASLFLTNYRDGKGRKRISFNLVYNIANYLIDKYKL